jgi:23S rRNA (cytidine2498-2'-O)-methyltransferase
MVSAPAGRKQQEIEPAFARQGLRVLYRGPALVEPICGALRPHLRGPTALHVWVPDTDAGNARSAQAAALRKGLEAALAQASGAALLRDGPAAREAGGLLAQVALLSDTEVAVGIGPAMQAHSLAPGGRLRSGAARRAPSRSAAKLDEALSWLGRGPEPGDVCVDLGAAPGGWTQVLLSRRAKVVAVDPGLLRPELRRNPDVEHLKMSAFQFEPEIPADWLLCDMAWRPLEVAALLAKWGRRHWARFLVCNIKLPMRRRAEMLRRVQEILKTGGWTGVRARQLYHDRDEVTLAAWRGFGVDARPPRKARPGSG